MQKGIGAAPFAIVAALIVALTVGFWATQSAQAVDGDATAAFTGTITAPAESGATIDATAAKAGIAFRGPTDRGSKVEVTVSVRE